MKQVGWASGAEQVAIYDRTQRQIERALKNLDKIDRIRPMADGWDAHNAAEARRALNSAAKHLAALFGDSEVEQS